MEGEYGILEFFVAGQIAKLARFCKFLTKLETI